MSNIILKIAEDIKADDEFRETFKQVHRFFLLNDFRQDVSSESIKRTLVEELYKIIIDEDSIDRLLQSAFIFASIREDECVGYEVADEYRNLSYTIGVSVLGYSRFYGLTQINKVIYRLFTRLGLMASRDEFVTTAPSETDIHSKIEFITKELENGITAGNHKKAKMISYMTDFQLGVLKQLRDPSKKVVGVSGPTSSGKNYAVKQYMLERLKSETSINICIVVPSKALIAEQQQVLSGEFRSARIDANIFTYGDVEGYASLQEHNKRNIFIFTQERLHYFFELLKQNQQLLNNFVLDVLVIDESYKISHGNRGVLLNHIAKTLLAQGIVEKLVLLSPLLKQLKLFGKILGIDEDSIHEQYSTFSPVLQNKLRVEELPNGRLKRIMHLCPLDKEYKLTFELELNFLPSEPSYKKKLSHSASLFARKRHVIIFRDGPSATQKQAEDLANRIPNSSILENKNRELIAYIKATLGDGHDLIGPLKKGVAFHHGKVPISIRTKIEEGFKNRDIHTICANNTLSEGVNLPVKYLFVGDDVKGRSRLDFNNLCGRVGRYTKHLGGSIFFINPQEYQELLEGFVTDNVSESPTSPISQILEGIDSNSPTANRASQFMDYLTASNYQNIEFNDDQEFEYLAGFLFDMYRSNPEGFDDFVRLNTTLGTTYLQQLKEKLSSISEELETVASSNFKEICRRNIFIDPRKLLNLYKAIRDRSHTPTRIPNIRGIGFGSSLDALCLSVAHFFLPNEVRTRNDNGIKFYSSRQFLSYWIQEEPIPRMMTLNSRLRSGKVSYSELFDTIDQEICFRFLNASNAYMDIAILCDKEIGGNVTRNDAPDFYDKKIISYIEYGANTPLVFFLMNKGMSRESVLALKPLLISVGIPSTGEPSEISSALSKKKKNIIRAIQNSIIRSEFGNLKF